MKTPGFSAVAVITLALGIGAHTAIFSMLNAALLHSLPVRDLRNLRVINWIGGLHDLEDVSYAGKSASPNTAGRQKYGSRSERTGATLPFGSEHSVEAAGDYTLFRMSSGAMSLHRDYRWQSGYNRSADLGPSVRNADLGMTKPFGIANARLTWASDLAHDRRLTLALWSKNLTDFGAC